MVTLLARKALVRRTYWKMEAVLQALLGFKRRLSTTPFCCYFPPCTRHVGVAAVSYGDRLVLRDRIFALLHAGYRQGNNLKANSRNLTQTRTAG